MRHILLLKGAATQFAPETEQGKVFRRFYHSAAVNQEPEVWGSGCCIWPGRLSRARADTLKVFSKPGKGTKFSLHLLRG